MVDRESTGYREIGVNARGAEVEGVANEFFVVFFKKKTHYSYSEDIVLLGPQAHLHKT